MNRADVVRYEALHWALYLAQVALFEVEEELKQQSACPQGHPFHGGFQTDGEGRVIGIKVNVNVTPKGRVTCRLCGARRGAEFRRKHRAGEARDGVE